MNNQDCSQIEELLVDYADGALDQSDADKVAAHLAQCSNCRNTLSALNDSLKLAKAIWQDNLHQSPAAKTRRRSITWRKYAAIAASIAILAATALIWKSQLPPKQPEPTLAQIEQEMFDSSTAAKILAIADMLAKQKSAQDFVKQQYSFVIRTYPNTPAAEKAKLKLGTI